MVEKRLLIIPHLSRLIIEGRYLRLCPSFSVTLAKTEIFDLSFASTETKFKNPITKTQNNIVIFGFFHKKIISLFWLFLK